MEGKGYEDTEYLVYVPTGYDGTTAHPLIVSIHGNGGTGPGEIKGWTRHADEHGWIIVCPTFQDSNIFNGEIAKKRTKLLEDLVDHVCGSLQVDRNHVLATGFSGGGHTVWYVATQLDKSFTALCFRSANFAGEKYDLSLKKWRDRPIYHYWGEHEVPNASKQNPEALEYMLKEVKPTRYKHEMIQGGKHEGRPDLASAWFASVIKGEGM